MGCVIQPDMINKYRNKKDHNVYEGKDCKNRGMEYPSLVKIARQSKTYATCENICEQCCKD